MSASEARVLILEDNDALRVLLFTILRAQPLGVDTATTAREALEKVKVCDYALILVDMDLPAGESNTFIRQFHRDRPESTTFILAVRDQSRDPVLDPELVSAVMNKPIEIDALSDIVRECALAVPPPEDPLPCPPAESDVRKNFDGDTTWTN